MKVLVIGDVIIDRYSHGTRRGISAETPTIVANLTREEFFVGGAGLVVRNLLRLGDAVTLLTIGGEDELSYFFRKSVDPLFASECTRLLIDQIELPGWTFTEKRRYFVEQYKLLQYDIINKGIHNKRTEDVFKKRFDLDFTDDIGAVVVCDNRHGTISSNIAKMIVKKCRAEKKPLYIDSQVSQSSSNHDWYRGADYIFLNEIELDKVLAKAGKITKKSNLDAARRHLEADIVYKRGERGAVLQSNTVQVSKGIVVDSVDTCGAGDALLAAFVHGFNDLDAANQWAALSTTYNGTIVPKFEDLHKVV